MGEKKRLLLIGGGGHCRSVLDSVCSANKYDRIGIIDNKILSSDLSVPIIGKDSDLPDLLDEGWTDAFISVGSVGDTRLRRKLYRMVKDIGFAVPVIVDPSAVVSADSVIEEGVFIGKRSVVNSGTTIGTGSILNTGAVIEHDCKIGDFSHISTGSILCGNVFVGMDSHIGAGSVVRQEVNIGNNVLIGAGSVVVGDVPDSVKAYGNPCRIVD